MVEADDSADDEADGTGASGDAAAPQHAAETSGREEFPRLRSRLRNASELLLCLDFDGTLAPIVEDPAAAEMTADNRNALSSLVDHPQVRTAVVSGRALSDVRERVGLEITYAGNHGLEVAGPDADSIAVHPVARKRARTVEAVCDALAVALDPIPNVRVENKRLTGTVHVRSTPRPARGLVERIVESVVDRFGGDAIETSPGKAIVEFGPALEWGKGDAVSLLEDRIAGDPVTLYAGDDVTDESAFREVEPDGIGIHVGDDESTAASLSVDSPAEVASLLRWLETTGVRLLVDDSTNGSVATES